MLLQIFAAIRSALHLHCFQLCWVNCLLHSLLISWQLCMFGTAACYVFFSNFLFDVDVNVYFWPFDIIKTWPLIFQGRSFASSPSDCSCSDILLIN